MNNIPLIIMAAGMSSRMKNSSDNSNLSKDQIFQSNNPSIHSDSKMIDYLST